MIGLKVSSQREVASAKQALETHTHAQNHARMSHLECFAGTGSDVMPNVGTKISLPLKRKCVCVCTRACVCVCVAASD